MKFFRFYNKIFILSIIGISFSSTENTNFYSESFALLIGIDKYHNWPQLNYAVADAERMQKLLTEKLDFPNDNIYMLLDEEATLLNIRKEMNNLKKIADENDRVLIYFAGHGITESLPNDGEEGYLVPVDGGEEDVLYITALPMSEMKRISDRVPAKDMLFLMDACYSGLMGVRGLSKDKNENISLKKTAAGGSRTVITAGRKGETSQERAEWGHSAFVKNIVTGLEKGMADYNEDTYITGKELGMYLTDQVTIDTESKQTPDISYFTNDKGDFVFIIGEVAVKIESSANDELGELRKQIKIQQDQLAKLTELMILQVEERQLDQGKAAIETQVDSDEGGKIVEVTETQVDSIEATGEEYKSAELETLEEEMEQLENEMEELGNKMTGLGTVLVGLEDEIDEAGDMEEGKEDAIKHLKSEMGRVGGEMGILGGEMAGLGAEIARVSVEIDKLKRQKQDSVNELVDKLKDYGIDIESEEIARIRDDVGNEIKDKIGIAEGKLIANCTFANSQTRYYADDPDEQDFVTIDDVSNDNWWRYNRSEGLFYQINGVFQSPNIKGSSFYGGVGRAFHRNEYQWIIGLEQLMFENVFQFYAEAFNKSITPDAWRLWDGENSLSTVFRKEDYLDWYNGQGYRAAGFVHIKNYFSIGAEYNQVLQSEMNNVLAGDKFREPYHVEEGDNVYIKSIVSAGYPVELSIRDEFQMYTTLIRTNSLDNSDLHYKYDHLYFNLLIPYAEKLNFNIKVTAGASNVRSSTWDTLGYHQNVFEIGGEGTLRGYNWKGNSSSHYQLTTIEVWFGVVGVLFDRAIKFESERNIFNSAFLSDLSDNISQDVMSSIGMILGRENFRLSYAKQITDNKESTLYLTFGTPLQYW